MNAEQKDQIRELHSSGLGYKKIAAQLGLSVNTVASFCKRQRGSESCPHCPQCGRSVVQTPHRKPKRFCSTQCHNTWWNHHAVSGNGKLQQLCPICKRAVFCLSQFAPKILFPSLLWEVQKGNGSWKKNITIRSLRIKPQFRF